MTPNHMPKRNGATAPTPKRHHDDCRCLECIDWSGKPTRTIRKGITSDAAYVNALKGWSA